MHINKQGQIRLGSPELSYREFPLAGSGTSKGLVHAKNAVRGLCERRLDSRLRLNRIVSVEAQTKHPELGQPSLVVHEARKRDAQRVPRLQGGQDERSTHAELLRPASC